MTAPTAQHSSKSVEWYTPQPVIELARGWGGGVIDCDPCSCSLAQERVRARVWYDRAADGLRCPWLGPTVICNPPGGVVGGVPRAVLWWESAVQQWRAGAFTRCLFVGFSMSLLRTTQRCEVPAMLFPICIPRSRLAFTDEHGAIGRAPTQDNVLVCLAAESEHPAFAARASVLGCVR